MSEQRVVVVGGGITGLTAAYRMHQLRPDLLISVFEKDDLLGGKIRSSSFAGVDGVDEGADAFLTRVPHAVALVEELGLTGELTSPAVSSANVWWNGMHEIPEGLLLGVPTDLRKLARSKLISWPGKARAALEPILPATGVASDSVGRIIRKRFGKQVHERLVDPLVGSIYAADTDRFSLAGVPQILELAANNRSLLLGARKTRRTAPTATGPIFATPTAGMAGLTNALANALRSAGATIHTGREVITIERSSELSAAPSAEPSIQSSRRGWLIDGEYADAVILASPARTTAQLLKIAAPTVATTLAKFDHAGVVIVTLAINPQDWPDELHRRSGYLVPKPVQKWVTAVSFASSKWAHWQRPDGACILRISLGRDGHDVTGESDEALLHAAITEVGHHVGITLQPTASRITRWPMAFPQYRPGHAARVRQMDEELCRDAPGIFLAGASYRGIGIPACIADGKNSATTACGFLNAMRD